MEFAADPNGDGKVKDRVDIINMSLGSDYGQPFDDDLSAAVDNATAFGILTVASAGNGSDKPYVAGTPASASDGTFCRADERSERLPAADAGNCSSFDRWAVPGGLPALVSAADSGDHGAMFSMVMAQVAT